MTDQISLLMALALWTITGCIVGLFFAMIVGTGLRGGFLGYVLLGIIGGLLSGLLFRAFGSGSMLASWQVNLMAGTVGALILMVIAEYAQRQQQAKKAQR